MTIHNIPFLLIKKQIILNYPKSATMELVPRDPRMSSNLRTSRGKRAISVRAIEVLLYLSSDPCVFRLMPSRLIGDIICFSIF